jgi:hypothetical protein
MRLHGIHAIVAAGGAVAAGDGLVEREVVPGRWNDHPFLVDLIRYSNAAGRTTADIDMMRDMGEIAENLLPMKDRANESDIVEVHATQEEGIDQNAIAGLQVFLAIDSDGPRHDMR